MTLPELLATLRANPSLIAAGIGLVAMCWVWALVVEALSCAS